MSVHIDRRILETPHLKRQLDKLVQTLSEDVAGVHYSDAGADDFAELDEAIASGLTEFLLTLDLPEQTSRGEAAMHEAADLDYERSAGL
jgi:hypothetical protein